MKKINVAFIAGLLIILFSYAITNANEQSFMWKIMEINEINTSHNYYCATLAPKPNPDNEEHVVCFHTDNNGITKILKFFNVKNLNEIKQRSFKSLSNDPFEALYSMMGY